MSNLTTSSISKPSTEFYLKTISGPLSGTVFRLSSKEIFIGRDPSNHISIPNDLKLSRKHARFIFTKGKYHIQNISSKNFIKINNETVVQSYLENNAVITIGESHFKFITVAQNQLATGGSSSPQLPNPSQKKPRIEKPNISVQKNTQNTKKLIAFSGAIIVLALIINMNTDPVSTEKEKLREIATTESLLEQVEKEREKNKNIREELSNSEKSTPEYQQAQIFYLKGFRDFQKGLYSLALSNFDTSLSIYPNHILARRYQTLAKTRMEELIDLNLSQGREHLDNGRYNFCISSFQNAMSQMNDKTTPRYDEANQLLTRCEILRKERFQ